MGYIDDAMKYMSMYPHHHINKWWICKLCSENYEIDEKILSEFYLENTIYPHQTNFIQSINFDELRRR